MKKKETQETALYKPEGLDAQHAEAEAVLALVRDYEITTQDAMDFAVEALGEVKAELKKLEAQRKDATAPMLQAVETVRSWFRPIEKFYSESERIWKTKIGLFVQAQEVAQAKALAEVQEAHNAGDAALVAASFQQAVATEVSLPSSVSVRATIEFEIVNVDKVPREYCSPDLTKIRAALSEGKTIEGVKSWTGTSVTKRK